MGIHRFFRASQLAQSATSSSVQSRSAPVVESSNTATEPVIRLEHVYKSYGRDARAVYDLSLDVRRGEVLALLGASGCGKTTTLRLIAGLERPDSGAIWLEGREVASVGVYTPPEVRRVGLVFQDYALFPHLTVAQQVAFPLHGRPKAERSQRVMQLLEQVGLGGFGERYPHQLSGGQQQRVALARALAPNPSVLLLDEPFSNLDATLRATLRAEVRSIVRATGTTTVFVTHDQEEALSMADRIAILSAGRLLQLGSSREIYLRPATREVATFVGECNLLTGVAHGATVECVLGCFPLVTPNKGMVEVMIRPEMLHLEPDAAGQALVERLTFFGHDQLVHLRLGDGTLLEARTFPDLELTTGEQVRVQLTGPVMAYPLV
jgi:iron(III) transport system ATP-binding protein